MSKGPAPFDVRATTRSAHTHRSDHDAAFHGIRPDGGEHRHAAAVAVRRDGHLHRRACRRRPLHRRWWPLRHRGRRQLRRPLRRGQPRRRALRRGQGGRRRLVAARVRQPSRRPWPTSRSSPSCTPPTGPRRRSSRRCARSPAARRRRATDAASLRWPRAGTLQDGRPDRGRPRRVAGRLGPPRRRPHPDDPRRRARRRPRAGRARGRAGAVAGHRRAGQPDRVADDHRQAARRRPLPARRDAAPQGRGDRGRQQRRGGAGARPRRPGRPHRGRRPPAGLPLLPPLAHPGVAGRADPAPGRWPHHRRDRPRLPHQRVDDGPADLAGEEDPLVGARRAGAADRGRAHGAPRRRDGRGLPDLQRGLHRHRRRRLDAPRPRRGGGHGWRGCCRRSRPTSRRCSGSRRCSRSRARGPPPASTTTAYPSCWRRRTAAGGTA